MSAVRLGRGPLALVLKDDRVHTASGRRGRVVWVIKDEDGEEIAEVKWDNGEEFSMRSAHLYLEEDVDSNTPKC